MVSVVTSKEKPIAAVAEESSKIRMKVWFCKQCGYVCFREDPPYICPISKAKREMFAKTNKQQLQGQKLRGENYGKNDDPS